jgi:Na+-driven multidrug efflux pump
MSPPQLRGLLADAREVARIAIPAILANVATPAGNAYVTAVVSPFGDSAVAGWAIVGRITPVAFGAIYALSGSVGPILGQNLGANAFDRARRTLMDALLVTAGYTAAAWLVLAVFAGLLVQAFQASGEAAVLIVLFCRWLAPLFVFLGALFVANAAFNTLGLAHYSTLFNWGRATLGTVPFVEAGARLFDAGGALAGNMLGGVAFGVLAMLVCYRHIDALAASSGSKAS